MSNFLEQVFKALERLSSNEVAASPTAPTNPRLPEGSKPISPTGWNAAARAEIKLDDKNQDAAAGKPVIRPGIEESLIEPVDQRPPMVISNMEALGNMVAPPNTASVRKAAGSTSTSVPSSSSSTDLGSSSLSGTSSPSSPSSTPPAPPAQPVRVSPNGPGSNPQAGQLEGLADQIAPRNDGRTRS